MVTCTGCAPRVGTGVQLSQSELPAPLPSGDVSISTQALCCPLLANFLLRLIGPTPTVHKNVLNYFNISRKKMNIITMNIVISTAWIIFIFIPKVIEYIF